MVLIDTERTPPAGRGKDDVLRDWVRALDAIASIAGRPQRLLPDIVDELARAQSDAPALLSARESFSYGALAARVNRYARWALDCGLVKGDVVGLMMPNRPEYLAIWLGLTGVGIVVALINTQLRGPSLAHCIDAAAPTHVIAAAEFCAVLTEAPISHNRPKLWAHGGGTQFDRIDVAVERFSTAPLIPAERRPVTIADRALLIYTSGTTGLPKAAIVSHRRVLQWSFWFAGLMHTGPDDRLYDCLPLYHSVGGVVAVGALLVHGGSVVIRDKFSANDFWREVAAYNCTLVQYIGELARYLLNAPHHPAEAAHRLRLACGNGLKTDIWQKFQHRFAIPRILEFYAATEANISLVNVEGKAGSIGRVPPFLAHRFPLALVEFDAQSAAPARGGDGFCIRCGAGGIGEAIGRIRGAAAEQGGVFEGYTDAADTERKVLRDVFERGDAWYRTGDLMRMDAAGFYYFIDRIGDTFRWKGENVSAAEVAAALTAFPGITDASVYGVHVANTDGAAGMAAIVCVNTPDLAGLREHLAQRLPTYAQPKFLRIAAAIAMTSTFKHSKTELQRHGFDPVAIHDPIYVDDAATGTYVRLDAAQYARIQAGTVRL
ncbi:MAG: long-chain-acyl-CoA synthetase [Hyphomicrobiales bacterium]|nr:long-chain-acyl-CoA synthetase [Hyphomicrobiales bacterium]